MNWKILGKYLLLLLVICVSALAKADTVWVDVRSKVEHNIDSIEGDVRISHGDIVRAANELFPDKDTEIYLYCLSGGRAGKAMSSLQKAGYTNVSNVGGIDDARSKRAISETYMQDE